MRARPMFDTPFCGTARPPSLQVPACSLTCPFLLRQPPGFRLQVRCPLRSQVFSVLIFKGSALSQPPKEKGSRHPDGLYTYTVHRQLPNSFPVPICSRVCTRSHACGRPSMPPPFYYTWPVGFVGGRTRWERVSAPYDIIQ